MNSEKIGGFITSCRKTKGLTQQKLADELGITNKAVSKWETGLGIPDVSLLPALSELLGVTVDELLMGEFKADKNNEDKKMKSHKSSDSSELALYLVNKGIIKFKNYVLLSVLFAVIGVSIPYFIWNETKDYTGFIFGVWFEICSFGVFYVTYSIMKNEIKTYNRMYSNEIDYNVYSNIYIKINMWFWILPPLVVFISMIFDCLSIHSLIMKFFVTVIFYVICCMFLWRKLFTKKQ